MFYITLFHYTSSTNYVAANMFVKLSRPRLVQRLRWVEGATENENPVHSIKATCWTNLGFLWRVALLFSAARRPKSLVVGFQCFGKICWH